MSFLDYAPDEFYTQVIVDQSLAVPKTVHIRNVYVTRDDQIPDLLQWLGQHKIVGYDTETGGLNPFRDPIATIQFGNPLCDDPRAYCICVRSVTREALQPVLETLASTKLIKLGQNIKFEGLFARTHFNQALRNVADTQLTEMILRAGLFPGGSDDEGGYGGRKPYGMTSMEALCLRYLNVQIDKSKDLRTSFYSTPPGQLTRRQVQYANGDVIYPFYVFEKQKELIKERKLSAVLRVEYGFLPCLIESQVRGLPLDSEAWTALWQEALERRHKAELHLDRLFLGIQPHLFDGLLGEAHVRPLYVGGKGTYAKPKPLNWSSPEHVRWAIRQYCMKSDWPIEILTTRAQVHARKLQHGAAWMEARKLTKDDVCADARDPEVARGRVELPDYLLPEDKYCILVDADKKTLKLRMIRGQLPVELVEALLAYGEEKPLVSTFGIDFLKNLESDGRIHTEFHQALPATGRVSSSPNLQNIPRRPEYRRCIRPPDGYAFVIADYSQIEPRLSAQVSQDELYLANYLDAKPDIYIKIGERLFGRTIDKHTPQGSEDRNAAKAIVLALAYRAGPGKLRDQLTLALEKPISYEQAAEWHRRYLDECSGIKEFQDLCNQLASPETGPKIWDDMVGSLVTYVTSPCGRHRFFPPDATNTYTESANHPIQAASATITKAAAVMIQKEIDARGWDAHGINYVHDEIVYEVRKDQANALALVVKQCMEAAGSYYLTAVPCIAEFPEGSNGVVPYWTKKLDNVEEEVF